MRLIPLACLAAVIPALTHAEPAFRTQDPALVALGQLLFYDPILSGNQGVSCASCHHPDHGTSDGLSLGLGDGAKGVARRLDQANLPEQRIPRNAPGLFNLGAEEFSVMFHDGRLEADPNHPSGLRTPLGEDMVAGFASVLSAQSMFPVLSPDEMAGHYSENDLSAAVRQGRLTGQGGAWDVLAHRVRAIPAYADGFAQLGMPDPDFTDISDAVAAFIELEWRADNSPYDRFLRDAAPLSDQAETGRQLFYGAAGCSTCHSGTFQTDHSFHAIAMPQIGPGKAARFETHARDTGRMRVTGDPADAYRFRTPSLRNVTATAPYGHAGAYATLDAVVRHHLDPVASLWAYDPSQARLPAMTGTQDFRILQNPAERQAIADANDLVPISLTDPQIDAILAFLDSLTDPASLAGRLGVPDSVPSGLPVDR